MEALTENEVHIQRDAGQFIMTSLMSLVAEIICWAIYLLIMYFTIVHLRARGLLHRGRLFTMVVFIIMFLASTAHCILDIEIFFYQIDKVYLRLGDGTTTLQAKQQSVESRVGAATSAVNILFACEFLLGDAVMIFRTWFLYAYQHYIMILPITVWLAAVSMLIADRIYIAGLHDVTNEFFVNNVQVTKVEDPYRLAYYSLSVATNSILLLLIAWKTWWCYHEMKVAFGAQNARSAHAARVLFLLMKVLFVYLLIWTIPLAALRVRPNYGSTWLFFSVLSLCGNQIAGIFPLLIVLLVERHRRTWNASSSDVDDYYEDDRASVYELRVCPGRDG